jgi:hypothetical protein
MCVSVSPGVTVRFSDTVLYAAEVIGQDGDLVHVLGYQNKVQGRAGLLPSVRGWLGWGGAGNAMILPFPAEPKTMTQANVLDTQSCRDVLQDIAVAVDPPSGFWGTLGPSVSWGSAPPPKVQVFQAAGIYTVVLAQDARDIPAALDQVPRSKRPELNPRRSDEGVVESHPLFGHATHMGRIEINRSVHC